MITDRNTTNSRTGTTAEGFGRRAPLFVGIVLYVVCAFAATFASSPCATSSAGSVRKRSSMPL